MFNEFHNWFHEANNVESVFIFNKTKYLNNYNFN
jgi:hypothetical protein